MNHSTLADLANLNEQEKKLYNLIQNSLESRVVSAYAKNFISIVDGRIDMDENGNIIQLVGLNDSGKSSMALVFAVIFYDIKPNKQVEMIHDSTNAKEFEIGLTFSDGVTISKVKRVTGESIWSLSHGGEVLYTNQKGTSLVSIKGVPEVIRKYSKALYEETTKEFINYRCNRDKLFLVHTNNGDNAKIINGLLQLETVNEATQRLNKKKNQLMTEYASVNTSINILKSQVTSKEVIVEREEVALEQGAENLQNNVERLLLISKMAELRKKIENNRPIKEVKEVDVTRLEALEHIKKLREEVNKPVPPVVEELSTERLKALEHIQKLREAVNKPIPPLLEEINTDRLRALENIRQLRENVNVEVYPTCEEVDVTRLKALENIKMLRGKLETSVVPEVTEVHTERLVALENIYRLYTIAQEHTHKLRALEKEEQEVVAKMEELKEKYDVRTCTNCGMLTTKGA